MAEIPSGSHDATYPPSPQSSATRTPLAERLGYPPGARLLIVSCDDLGSTYGSNVGIYEALREGLATSAGLMVPAPWAREAASRYRGEDVGVHLTLNAEHELYRWGPITQSPSLLDGEGGFPRTVADVWEHADLSEVRRECRSQIERAIYWGFDVSHLDSHLAALELRAEFFDVYLELALDFRLPIRLPDPSRERAIGFPLRELATEAGAVFPDRVVTASAHGGRRALEQALTDPSPGVVEVCLRPAADSPEQRALDPDWAVRSQDLHALTADGTLAALARRSGAILIGYRALRDLARSGG